MKEFFKKMRKLFGLGRQNESQANPPSSQQAETDPFSAAVNKITKSWTVEAKKSLYDDKGNFNANAKNDDGTTLLHEAVRYDSKELISALIEGRAKISRNRFNELPAEFCQGDSAKIEEMNAFLEAEDKRINSPISHASEKHAGSIKGVLVQGASKLKKALTRILPGKQKTTNRENMDGRF